MKRNNFTENLYTQEARTEALLAFGWEVDGMSEKKDSITIPESFDNIWQDYNRLQNLSGFDLRSYKGYEVEKFTYTVLNFPVKTENEILVNILIYNGVLIGGDCMSPALSGFIIPLDRRFAP